MNEFPIDLVQQCIFSLLDFPSQLELRSVSKRLNRLKIYDLLNISKKYQMLITDDILKMYPDVRYLYAHYQVTDKGLTYVNPIQLHTGFNKIRNVCHMTNLKVLKASYCRITNDSLIGLNLTRLTVSNNDVINDINHLTNLIYLDASSSCGLNDDGIKGLTNLIELRVAYNRKITNVNHMKKLEKLIAYGNSGINDDGITGINVVELDVSCNKNVTCVRHMTNLKILHASYHRHDGIEDTSYIESGIDDNSLIGLDLHELYVEHNFKVTNVSHLKNLKKLRATGSGLRRDRIVGLSLNDLILNRYMYYTDDNDEENVS